MDMNKVFDRFIERSPVTVMARIVIQRAINAEWVDEVFEHHRQQQYTRALMFSTVVDLMSLVALGMRPSLHAAARAAEDLPVSLTALYDKVNRAEPAVMRALVQGSAERLGPVLSHLRSPTTPWLAGYRIRVVDGNHLPGSEKRLAVLREVRGAALPGLSLVVYDPEMGLVVDLEPCEDGHSNERTLMRAILETAQPGEVWLADRNFCTRPILGALAQRGASFLIREHRANVRPTPRGLMHQVGRVETGMVYEQRVEVGLGTGQMLAMRRIELRLDQPTEEGETCIRLLANLPGEHLDACDAARLYRRRWTIEGMFQRLESVLNSEIRPLGHPRAALLAFAVAIVAYQVLVVLEAAVAANHDLESQGIELSTYYLADEVKRTYEGMMVALPEPEWHRFDHADEVKRTYEGMMVALPEPEWHRFDHRSPAQLAKTLDRLAAHVKPRKYRKNPRKPKVKRKPGYAPRAAVQRHVATARMLRNAGMSQGP